MRNKMKNLVLPILAILSLSLLSCEEITQKLDSSTLYKKDMIITLDGVTREGVITMPFKETHNVRITARGDLDMFVMSDCEGEWTKERAWNVTEEVRGGLFGWGKRTIEQKRQVDFQYKTSELNRNGSCAVYLYGFSKNGKHSEGVIDFQSDAFQLEGTLQCNKISRKFDGVEMCDVRSGKFTTLKFLEDVYFMPPEGCEIGSTYGKVFTFGTPKGICTYRIKGVDSGKVGRFTTFGHTGILIRE